MEAIKRLYAARLMCLAPHVCDAVYRGEPMPIGWIYVRAEALPG